MKRLFFLTMIWLASISYGYAEGPTLMMATTTSTESTGLLDYLAPHFEKDTGITLKWVAVGTGKALEYGKNCDVDVLLVHAPAAEMEYVNQGYGIDRKEVMYNDFIIIGPESDPAAIKNLSAREALAAIRALKANFISRGDQSGTHKMELSLWKEAGIPTPDKDSWYIQAGQGMLMTINMAAEKNGYTLTDRGTYITYEKTMNGAPPLKILVANDSRLFNQYSVIIVNPKNCPQVKPGPAKEFSDWITGKGAQALIGNYMFQGKALFMPNAGK
ncbi:MAG: tungsten ABC transporter substrate-binding protein [Desulfobacterales bacterium CG23_combo_of_CG06-09_8_20_14_all_51_8]|nr:MAG: tungsten ABC transporter substrate-binding protein [Desulfobacterales bacterium CG23_combo_of_CG06-09_8_20_14_all_51_8]